MNLVDEYDGPRAVLPRPFGIGHDLLDFLDPGQHRGKLDELRLRHVRNNLRQRGFACSRRPPENQRARIIAIHLRAQRFSRAYQMFLPNIFIQRARTHAVGQRRRRSAALPAFGMG